MKKMTVFGTAQNSNFSSPKIHRRAGILKHLSNLVDKKQSKIVLLSWEPFVVK